MGWVCFITLSKLRLAGHVMKPHLMLKTATLIGLALCTNNVSAQLKVRGQILQKVNATTWLFCSVVRRFSEPSEVIDSAKVGRAGRFGLNIKTYAPGTIFKVTITRPVKFSFPENALYFTNESTGLIFISIPGAEQLYKASIRGSKVGEDMAVIVQQQSSLIDTMRVFAAKKITPVESTRVLVQVLSEQKHWRRQIEEYVRSGVSGSCLLLTLYFYCALNFIALDNSGRLRNVSADRLPTTSLAESILKELQSYPVMESVSDTLL